MEDTELNFGLDIKITAHFRISSYPFVLKDLLVCDGIFIY